MVVMGTQHIEVPNPLCLRRLRRTFASVFVAILHEGGTNEEVRPRLHPKIVIDIVAVDVLVSLLPL